MPPTNRMRMNSLSNFDLAVEQSVAAGKLLRSSIEGFLGNKAYVSTYFNRYNPSTHIDHLNVSVAAFIQAVTKEEGREIRSKRDVFKAIHRAIQRGYREEYKSYINGRTSGKIGASELSSDGITYVDIDSEFNRALPADEVFFKSPQEVIREMSISGNRGEVYASALALGYNQAETAEMYGVSKEAVRLGINRFKESKKGKNLKKLLCEV